MAQARGGGSTVVLWVLACACGGRTLGTSDSDASARPDARAGRTDATATETGPASACVDVAPTSADLACASDADCTASHGGRFCSGQCWACQSKDTPMNVAAAARYQAQVAALPGSTAGLCAPCPPPTSVAVACLAGSCVSCTGPSCKAPPPAIDSGAPEGRPDPRPDASGLREGGLRDATLDAPGEAALRESHEELDAARPLDDAGRCASPLVNLRLTAPPGSGWWINGSDNADTPRTTWLTFFTPDGTQLYTYAGEGLSLDCRTCATGWPYGFGEWSAPLPKGGATGTWNGLSYLAGTCGSNDAACLTPVCMPAGDYVAEMCGAPEGGASEPTCVDVPFHYPTTMTVAGNLP